MGQVFTDMMNPTSLYPTTVLKQLQEPQRESINFRRTRASGRSVKLSHPRLNTKNTEFIRSKIQMIQEGIIHSTNWKLISSN
jgi:hypothetical protein